MKEIEFYRRLDGEVPMRKWLDSIRDQRIVQRFDARFQRIIQGNLGDYKAVGGGVKELRFHFGSGYRIYFAEDGDTVVVLLCGGDKATQDKDISTAKSYWSDYKDRRKGH